MLIIGHPDQNQHGIRKSDFRMPSFSAAGELENGGTFLCRGCRRSSQRLPGPAKCANQPQKVPDTTLEELKDLQKAVKKAKRIAAEKAGELHDLVEDRLPAAYEEIPAAAQATYDACRTWAETNARLQAAETEAV